MARTTGALAALVIALVGLPRPAHAGDGGAPPPACADAAAQYESSKTPQNLASLARCHDDAGRVATAARLYAELAELRTKSGDTGGATSAKQRAEALLSRAPRLRVDVRGAARTDVTVELDGAKLEPARYGLDEPVDPGEHKVRVLRGSDVLKVEAVLAIESKKAMVSLDLDAIAAGTAGQPPTPPPAAPTAPAQPPPPVQPVEPPRPPQPWVLAPAGHTHWASTMGQVFIVIGVGGLLLFGALEGGALGVTAGTDCTSVLEDRTICSDRGFEEMEEARRLAEGGQWSLILASTFVAAGIIAVVAAPSKKEAPRPAPPVVVAPQALRGGGGVWIGVPL